MPVGGLPLMVSLMPGLDFRIDTGSDMSFISERHLSMLDSMGYKVDKVLGFTAGRDTHGDITFHTTRYIVDIPVYRYEMYIDGSGKSSTRMIPSSLNVLRNVEFVLSPDDMSVFGIDFLEKFKVEYRYRYGVVSLYFDRPEGYESSIPLMCSRSLSMLLWLSERYYLDAHVLHREYRFFIDTGLQRVNIKLPMDESCYSNNNMYSDTIVTLRGAYPALVDNSSWVSLGNRSGSRMVYYYDTDEEPCAMNPLNLFEQDVLMDFSGREILMRPYFNIPQKKSGYQALKKQ